LHPGTHAELVQTLPAGQSPSPVQRTQVWLVGSHTGFAGSRQSLEPRHSTHVCVALSHNSSGAVVQSP
jgi:hypothetical protein